MSRGSRFSSILTWFREANADEVRAIMPLVLEACGKRHILISTAAVARKQHPTKQEMERRRLNDGETNAKGATA